MHSPEPPEIDWEPLLPRLHALARSLVKTKKWFREGSDSFSKGQKVEDYVYEGISRYLTHPEKFRVSVESSDFTDKLVDYIGYNIIRSLISNDIRSAENRTSNEEFRPEEDENDESTSYQDAKLPLLNAYFDEQIDYDTIMREIQDAVKDDPNVEAIFFGLSDGMKRRDIIKEFSIPENEYNNGKRRLDTILKNIATKFNLQNQTR